jgi:hypothetical protein
MSATIICRSAPTSTPVNASNTDLACATFLPRRLYCADVLLTLKLFFIEKQTLRL